jgi:hypothetical protein
MKKFAFKKLALMIMFLLSFSFILTGCGLFELNLQKHYDTVVVKIEYPDGDNITINKKDLIVAFNNYGVSLVRNYNYSTEEALDRTITALINQRVLLKDSENKIVITNKDKNELWENTLKSLEANIDSYATAVRIDWNIEKPTSNEEETGDVVLYTEYQPKATLVFENGEYVIKVTNFDEQDENVELKYADMNDVENTEVIVSNLYATLLTKTEFSSSNSTLTDLEKLARQEARVYEEAIKRYTVALKQNEKGLKLSTDNVSVFKREVERVYSNRLESLKVTKAQELIAYQSANSKITTSHMISKYREMLAESYQKYSLNPSAFNSDVLSNFANINYTQNQNYFFVSHILLKFSDAQQKEYDSLKTRLESGEISPAFYQNRLEQLTHQIVAVERDAEGKIISSSNKTSETVLNEVQNALAGAITDQQKADAFKNLVYKYNQDPGALNAEYLYVIGTENSQMVETFTEASRQLHTDGVFGGISGLVPSSYGVHIVFYAGPITNNSPILVNSINNISVTVADLLTLSETRLNPLHNKTIFDKVYEALTEENSASNESMHLNTLKKDLVITKYKSAYQDLLR